jgi:hypothetical protein
MLKKLYRHPSHSIKKKKKKKEARHWWLIPVILVTQEAEIGG